LKLIGGQMQTRLDERMIEHAVLFATGHERESSQIGEHGPGAIVSVEPEESTFLEELVCRKIARDQGKGLAPFRATRSRSLDCQTSRAIESCERSF